MKRILALLAALCLLHGLPALAETTTPTDLDPVPTETPAPTEIPWDEAQCTHLDPRCVQAPACAAEGCAHVVSDIHGLDQPACALGRWLLDQQDQLAREQYAVHSAVIDLDRGDAQLWRSGAYQVKGGKGRAATISVADGRSVTLRLDGAAIAGISLGAGCEAVLRTSGVCTIGTLSAGTDADVTFTGDGALIIDSTQLPGLNSRGTHGKALVTGGSVHASFTETDGRTRHSFSAQGAAAAAVNGNPYPLAQSDPDGFAYLWLPPAQDSLQWTACVADGVLTVTLDSVSTASPDPVVTPDPTAAPTPDLTPVPTETPTPEPTETPEPEASDEPFPEDTEQPWFPGGYSGFYEKLYPVRQEVARADGREVFVTLSTQDKLIVNHSTIGQVVCTINKDRPCAFTPSLCWNEQTDQVLLRLLAEPELNEDKGYKTASDGTLQWTGRYVRISWIAARSLKETGVDAVSLQVGGASLTLPLEDLICEDMQARVKAARGDLHTVRFRIAVEPVGEQPAGLSALRPVTDGWRLSVTMYPGRTPVDVTDCLPGLTAAVDLEPIAELMTGAGIYDEAAFSDRFALALCADDAQLLDTIFVAPFMPEEAALAAYPQLMATHRYLAAPIDRTGTIWCVRR